MGHVVGTLYEVVNEKCKDILVTKPEVKNLLEDPRVYGNIILKQTSNKLCEDMAWIQLT